MPVAIAVSGGSAPTVLLVEDDVLVRRSLVRLLRRAYCIVEADSAEAALAMLSCGAQFDAVLCDMTLGGMSGGDFVMTLAALGDEHTERVVILSGVARESLHEDVLALIGDRFLEKPASIAHISEVVATLVTGHARAA